MTARQVNQLANKVLVMGRDGNGRPAGSTTCGAPTANTARGGRPVMIDPTVPPRKLMTATAAPTASTRRSSLPFDTIVTRFLCAGRPSVPGATTAGHHHHAPTQNRTAQAEIHQSLSAQDTQIQLSRGPHRERANSRSPSDVETTVCGVCSNTGIRTCAA